MTRLAFSTNAFTRFSLAEALAGIKRAGYAAAEILADVPHAYAGGLNATLICAIARDVEKLGLQISNINANCSFGYFRDPPPEAFFEPSLISPRPLWREDRLRMIGKAMELARAVGCSCVSVTSGRMLEGVGPKKAEQLFDEGIRRVLEMADRFDVRVGIECEPGLYVELATELQEWIARSGHPRLGANLDVGHSQVMGEEISEVVQLLAGRIWNLHVEDIPGRKHYHLIPGEGTLDWQALRRALAQVGYDGFATVELYTQTENPEAAARRSWDFLQKLFA